MFTRHPTRQTRTSALIRTQRKGKGIPLPPPAGGGREGGRGWHIFLAVFCLFLASPALAAPQVQEVKTPGGLTAWLVEDHHLPMISLRLVFRESGSAYVDAPPGTAIFAMSMLSEGAGDFSSEAFDAALQENALSMGFSADYDKASASLDALSDRFEAGMKLLSLALTQPTFAPADLSRVRGEMLTRLRLQEQSPDYRASRLFRETLYGTHPYAAPLLGTEETLSKATPTTLRHYLSQALRRDRLVISVSGDITPARLSTLLDTYLGSLPAAKDTPKKLPLAILPTQKEPLFREGPFPQAVAMFALPGISRQDKDFYAAHLMNYLIGGGGFESRLTDAVRRARGLTYSISTGLVSDDGVHMLQGGFATDAAKAREAVAVVRETLRTAAEKGFTEDELARAKSYITGSFPLDIDANRELATFLTVMQMEDLGIDYLAKRNALMSAVTLADVNRMATRLLNPDRMVSITIGDLPK